MKVSTKTQGASQNLSCRMHYLPGCVKGCGGATVAIDVMDRCSTVANHRQPTPAACGPSPGTTTAEHRPARTCRSNRRSEEHTSELQSLMRISYAVFCLKTKN